MKRFGLIAAMTLWASVADAHSPLQGTVPADGASVAAMPDALTMQFRGKIRLTKVTLAFDDGAPQDLDLGDQTNFATDYAIKLPDAGQGPYVVEWRGLGDDGHAQTGMFVFYVE